MRLRWKLLILLLVIALVPLGVALWFGQSAAADMADDLALGAREALTADAKRFLLQTVQDHGKLLRHTATALEHYVRIQALEVERCLAGDPPSAPEIHFAADFESKGAIADLTVSDRHVRVHEDETTSPTLVSYERQSFLLAPGCDKGEVADDLARLSKLLPTYQLIHQFRPVLIHWQYTTLSNGVHTTYPGHGRYPEGYDPRQRLWYSGARERAGLRWSPPMVDASTRQAVLTLSMPVHRPDGSFAGATAIDIRITDLVKTVELPVEWTSEAETMIVYPLERSETGERAILIIAHQDLKAEGGWDVPIVDRVLTSSDGQQYQKLLGDLVHEKAAVRDMPYEGRHSLWAYGPLYTTESSLLVILPYERVLAPALAAEADVRKRVQVQRTLIGALLLGVVVTVVVLSMLASRHVTRPIQELAAATHRIAAGDLDTPTRITTRDELGELGATVNAMLPQLRDRLKLKESLTLAMEVQQNLLPQQPPRIPGLDIAGTSIYCDETGGDYYDFIDLSQIDPHTLGVAVGDVTGHGVAAALLMATARAFLRGRVGHPGGLGGLMNHMNRRLAADVPADKFMTLCYLLLDARAKTVRWANAGHDPAIVYKPDADEFSALDGSGMLLGVETEWRYEEFGPEPLVPGQVIVIGTDGIWEARNQRDQVFGKQRLRETIRAAGRRSASEISSAITAAVAAFRGDRFQDDDLTLVVIKVEPR